MSHHKLPVNYAFIFQMWNAALRISAGGFSYNMFFFVSLFISFLRSGRDCWIQRLNGNHGNLVANDVIMVGRISLLGDSSNHLDHIWNWKCNQYGFSLFNMSVAQWLRN